MRVSFLDGEGELFFGVGNGCCSSPESESEEAKAAEETEAAAAKADGELFCSEGDSGSAKSSSSSSSAVSEDAAAGAATTSNLSEKRCKSQANGGLPVYLPAARVGLVRATGSSSSESDEGSKN